MSWAYVPASADWNSDCTSPSRVQIQSYLSSRTNSVSLYSNDDGQESQSGPMFLPLTDAPGAASSMSSLQDSPASPGALPASASASRMSGGSSRRSASSFARWTPNGSSWRTFQLSLLEEGLPLFSGRWPTSGLMRSGECFPASNWEPVTSESESLSWATPVAGNCKGEASNNRDLCASAKMWNTPTACEDEGTGISSRGTPKLKGQAKQWQTPIATDSTGSPHYTDGTLRLTGQVKPWPTPTAIDAEKTYDDRGSLGTVSHGHLAQRDPGSVSPGNYGQLNPRFVQWLMGFPEGWTQIEENVCELWATQCRLQLQLWLGESLRSAC
jgi:hypothetical protein